LNYSPHFDDIAFTATPILNNAVQVTLQSSLPGSTIRYTTDNSLPTLHSPLYSAPVNITKTGTLKALLFDKNSQSTGRLFKLSFRIHKAVGAQLVIQNKPIERFDPGAAVLVNGVFGSNRYNDSQWVGFSGNDLNAVIDLGKAQPIERLGVHVLNYHWQRMWAPVYIQFLGSTDGEHYAELYRQDSFAVNGINIVDVPIKPVKARYIKVLAVNKGVIPTGEYGAGGNALLLLDEIVVE
jgi:hexosaminidase